MLNVRGGIGEVDPVLSGADDFFFIFFEMPGAEVGGAQGACDRSGGLPVTVPAGAVSRSKLSSLKGL